MIDNIVSIITNNFPRICFNVGIGLLARNWEVKVPAVFKFMFYDAIKDA